MKRLYKIIRSLLVIAAVLMITIPAMVYVLLSLPTIQQRICSVSEKELTELLGAETHISHITIQPFNRVTLHDVEIVTSPGDTAIKAQRLGGGIRMGALIFERKIVVSYVEIVDLDGHLYRPTADSPLNIQPIIDHLSSKDRTKPSKHFDLRVDNVVIRNSRLRYNILDRPRTEEGTIDPGHLQFYEIMADLQAPRITNDLFRANIRRLTLKEQSGLTVTSLSLRAMVSADSLSVRDMTLELPRTRLIFDDMSMKYDGWESLKTNICNIPANIGVETGSYICPADMGWIWKPLRAFSNSIDLDMHANGSLSDINMEILSAGAPDEGIDLEIRDMHIAGLPHRDSLRVELPNISLKSDGRHINDIISGSEALPTDDRMSSILDSIGPITCSGSVNLTPAYSTLKAILDTRCGQMSIDSRFKGNLSSMQGVLALSATASGLKLGTVTGQRDFGTANLKLEGDIALNKKVESGKTALNITELEYKGYSYTDVTANATFTSNSITYDIACADPNLMMSGGGTLSRDKDYHDITASFELLKASPHALGLATKHPDHILKGRGHMQLHGSSLDNLDGRIELSQISYLDGEGNGPAIEHISLISSGSTSPQYLLVHSDVADIQIEGTYRFNEIAPVTSTILANIMPDVIAEQPMPKRKEEETPISIHANMTLRENATTENLLKFFNTPLRIIYPVEMEMSFDEPTQRITAGINAPHLLQKDKFIDSSHVALSIDGLAGIATIKAATLYPTKKGNAKIAVDMNAHDDNIGLKAGWDIDHARTFKGDIGLNAELYRNGVDNSIGADIDLHNSQIVLNDTVWDIHRSTIDIADNAIRINGFEISRDNQFLKINGTASDNPDDRLHLQLLDIDLDYVFETLDIWAAMFGGTATGDFHASGLLGSEPHIETPGLKVKRLTYNKGVLGDAVIKSRWNNDTRGIDILADIRGEQDHRSYVDGAIYPMADSLDFKFKADRLNVAFMKPFMEAFTSDVQGYASGEARLYGTFKLIDMTGDILTEDLRLKIDFTNTYYTATDSIHLTPGRIQFGDVTLLDSYGNKAKLDGWVRHKCFKEPSFEFRVNNARNFLCYDVTDKLSPDWYGRIFCNGQALVKGRPGFIDINVDISTAPKSVFTFVLNDTEDAGEYTFMHFNDREAIKGELLMSVEDPRGTAVKRMKERYARMRQEISTPTIYRINLQVDANPQGEMILVMDPAGGDRIKARGDGALRMEYESSNDDFKMFGTYTLQQGSYNFTLQDIIIKDFTIKPGSSITFHGDPLNASLDIEGVYSVNANLSDLDESFLQDKDLNRTNVPVHALLKVNGDMQQPDISFDLEFPTLTQDIYRKVRSIVSTEDMMNRQIIYLLALNRFYTPDYMASTTKGNELMSVASSTISSQLSSMLGQLSDNWSIAPNIRSDRGDFSDMEVDLALSSYLLNNRLLFNGNFGYRDKALNNNSFIGDFDIEYLLNRSGSIRLKAYNRYNDQNYFVKSALTTQGVGVVFKRDFDDLFSIFRRKHKIKPAEAIPAEPAKPTLPSDTLLMITPRGEK